jgi:hypothetical protein
MRFAFAPFIVLVLIGALLNKKGDIPLPFLALIITIIIIVMMVVYSAIKYIIRAVAHSATVRSLLFLMAFAVVAMSVVHTNLPTIASTTVNLNEQSPSSDPQPSLDHKINYAILDYDAFLDASNRKARDLVEWVVDERSEDWRKRLLIWHRHMATLTSTLNPSLPAMTEFMERWQDVTTYLQSLPISPDPMDIYQKVWRTVRSFHIVKRDMTMLGLD